MILVTGGAGFIGSHLAERLSKEEEVRVLDNLSAGSQNLADLKEHKNIQFMEGDIRDAKKVQEAVFGCSAVFHLAAMNRAQRSIEKPLEANEINITGTLNVLEACRQNDAYFCFASSSSVYGGKRGTEDAHLEPMHPYGVGKMASEHYGRVYNRLYGVKASIVRYVSVFGPRQRGDLDHAAVIPKFIDQVLEGKPVSIFGKGDQTRQFTYVEDTVDGTLAAWKKESRAEAYNIASGEETSVARIVEGIEKLTGKKAVRKFHPLPPADPLRNVIDVRKAKDKLGFFAKTAFLDGLEKTVAWRRLSP